MALAELNNGITRSLTPEQGRDAWLVLNGEEQGTPQQQAFCLSVKRLLLNWRSPLTPVSYLKANKPVVLALARLHQVRLPELTQVGVDRMQLAAGEKE